MPTALHPQAKFDPFPPDLDVHGLVDRIPNFKWAQKVSRDQIRRLGQLEFEKLIQIHVVNGGKPLVIQGWDALLPRWLFNVDWLEKTYDRKQENVRDIVTGTDIPMTMGHYLRSMKQLTNQWTLQNFRDERRQRLYLKDMDCPHEWQEHLQSLLHPNLFYLNDNVTAHFPGDLVSGQSSRERHGDDVLNAAPAGDLMSSLPKAMRAENLMCYIGHEGTFTPAHREMCASLGHNIMIEASSHENQEKPGSSVWFMTESKDRDVVREYFLSMLGHDIEIEKHFAQINAWKKAPFDVYIVEQRPGDFIIIPPLAAHQVWNIGTRTMKVAWNRTTPETLRLALHEALPKARLVCRDEQYKNKAIIYFTLDKYYDLLREMEREEEINQNSFMGIGRDIVRSSPRARQLSSDFKSLFRLFTEILVDETFAFKVKNIEMLPFDSCVTCSYCRSNIFNRFLTCKHCIRTLVDGDEDAYDVCMECYAMGRSCACVSGLQWCEQWQWASLIEKYETWREMVIINDGFIDLHSSPPPFEVARQVSRKKSVAQICQEALIRRPWRDITKEDYGRDPIESDREETDEKPRKKKRKQKEGDVKRCHVCCHKDYSYRVHECSNQECAEAYCYGVLYRAFDMMPQAVQQEEFWQCPKCLGICNCGHCRRAGNTNPYTPRNTSLGHDTRAIADDRSVEALVDFRVHNLGWLKAAGEKSRSKDSRRMQRLRQQADSAKVENADDSAVDHHDDLVNPEHDAQHGGDVPLHATSGTQGDDSRTYESGSHAFAARSPNTTDVAETSEVLQPQVHASRLVSLRTDAASSYPDPPANSNYGIGMGYYQQDDSPDKILFDPYKEPAASAIRISDHEIPNSVKKSIRAAKRKARRDNEDPDFTIGRSHHKRSRPSSNTDIHFDMDPALFNVYQPAHSLTPTVDKHQDLDAETQGSIRNPVSEEADASTQAESALVVDSREPSLRHARPLTSYVEIDDPEDEVPEDEVPEEVDSDEEVFSLNVANGLPDQAVYSDERETSNGGGAKIAEVVGQEAAAAATATPLATGVSHGVKKRGRPLQKASRGQDAAGEVDYSKQRSPAAETSIVKSVKRGRGRPKRAETVFSSGANTPAPIQSAADKPVSDVAPKSDVPVDGRRLRRMRKDSAPPSESSMLSRHQSCSELEDGHENKAEAPEEVDDEFQGSERPSSQALRPSKSVSRLGQRYLSMAERLALRGRKFKIGQRSTAKRSLPRHRSDQQDTKTGSISEAQGSSNSDLSQATQARETKTSQTDNQRARDKSDLIHRPHSEIDSPPSSASSTSLASQQPTAFVKSKTIVRLTDIVSSDENDGDDNDHVAKTVSSDDSDESDIPASGIVSSHKSVVLASSISRDGTIGRERGRGGGRARGKGRGRGRGRPRGGRRAVYA